MMLSEYIDAIVNSNNRQEVHRLADRASADDGLADRDKIAVHEAARGRYMELNRKNVKGVFAASMSLLRSRVAER